MKDIFSAGSAIKQQLVDDIEDMTFEMMQERAKPFVKLMSYYKCAMITRFGMSEDFDMVAMETVTNQYLGGDASLVCSAETQAKIDNQVIAFVKKQHQKATQILTENRAKLNELANYLYEHEAITGDEFVRILNS